MKNNMDLEEENSKLEAKFKDLEYEYSQSRIKKLEKFDDQLCSIAENFEMLWISDLTFK